MLISCQAVVPHSIDATLRLMSLLCVPDHLTMTRTLGVNGALLFLYMGLVYTIAWLRRRLDTVDIAWGLGFILVAWMVLIQQYSVRSRVVATLVTIWGIRLSGHIYLRARRRGDDPRYAAMSKKWRGNLWLNALFRVFLLQGALIWIISLPIVLASNRIIVSSPSRFLAVGIIIWLIGFFVETIADAQLARYLKHEKRPKVLQTGLWRYSRHPNYYGELLQWWAIGIIALQVSYGWVGLAGPLTLSFLIIFVSGIPPIEKRRAKDAAYRDYQRRTSIIVPWFPKKSKKA